MQPPTPYDLSQLPDGSLAFRPRFSLLAQLEWLVSSRRRLSAAAVLATVTGGILLFLLPPTEEPGLLLTKAFLVSLGLLTVAAMPAAWLAHRRRGELRFDVAQRSIIRGVGRAVERMSFSRVEGIYCVRDQWTGVEEDGVPVVVFEVSVRVPDERIVLARCATREEAEQLRELVTAVLR